MARFWVIFWAVIALVAAAAGWILSWAARSVPGFADMYTRRIYPRIVGILGGFWGKLPFSAVEILLYASILFWLLLLIVSLAGLLKRKQGAFGRLIRRILAFAAFCCVLFFLYAANCGINYYAEPFSQAAGLERGGYDTESLKAACRAQTQELIELSPKVKRDGNGCLLETSDWKEEAVKAMTALGKQYPQLAAKYPRPKPVLVSRILSVQEVTGVYSPFTIEANYNTEMTSYNIPFTMCHELSHLCGFMREDEANFIGWLAGRQSDSVEFRYSSAMLGWINCTNELAKYDLDAYRELYVMLPDEVKAELEMNTDFWDKYEGKASELHEQVNDTYLKVNGQTEGVRSYARMVELIVSYYQKQGLSFSGKE